MSFVEILILYELWAGERLVFEKAVLRYRRPGRPISVSAVPCGPGTDIWRSCRFTVVLITAGFGTLVGQVWPRSHFHAERISRGGMIK